MSKKDVTYRASGVSLSNITVTNCGGSGMKISGGVSATILNSKTENNGSHGIDLSDNKGGKVHLEGNQSYENKGAGFLLDGDSNIMAKNNIAARNEGSGFVVTGSESKKLTAVLDEVLANIDSWKLSNEDRKELQSDIATIKLQLESNKPKKVIIRESLQSLRTIAEGVASSTLFASIGEIISSFS